jgi:hypothetical protein
MDAAREFSRRESLKTRRKAADSSRIHHGRRVKGPSRSRTRVKRKANKPESIHELCSKQQFAGVQNGCGK